MLYYNFLFFIIKNLFICQMPNISYFIHTYILNNKRYFIKFSIWYFINTYILISTRYFINTHISLDTLNTVYGFSLTHIFLRPSISLNSIHGISLMQKFSLILIFHYLNYFLSETSFLICNTI